MKESVSKISLTMITGNKKKLEEFIALIGKDLAAKYNVSDQEIDCIFTPFTL